MEEKFEQETERVLEEGKVYRHFKGNEYYVIGTGYNSEENNTEEMTPYVFYQALYAPFKRWYRPLKMFMESADTDRADNITHQKYRFELVPLSEEEINARLKFIENKQ